MIKGVGSIVQNFNFRVLAALLALGVAFLGACGGGAGNPSPGGVDPNETAATVNGKAIKFEDVERAVKQQAQGQEAKLSPLELAGARLQVLQSLIEQEVMFQKAEKEGTVPTEEEVTAEVNKRKVDSRLSSEEFNKQMTQAGLDEKSFRENIRKGLAIQKLVDKITGKIEVPKDSEIEAFYKGNPDMFVRKRGVRLAAIVIDPSDSGEGDLTKNDAEASQRVKEVLDKLKMPGSDFGSLAREYSEDPSKLQGGELGYLSEDELKQNFGAQVSGAFMNPQFTVGQITNMVPANGKGYIFKLEERVEKDENLTLESPNVRPQINDLLVSNRKQLLAASYQALAMNEAKIENFLAKKVVDNPNELSGARPAPAANLANTSNPAANANAVSANTSPSAVLNTNAPHTNTAAAKPEVKPTVAKPTATAPAPANTSKANN
jgi:parvulin-like peptidyl-prolyl isomerase